MNGCLFRTGMQEDQRCVRGFLNLPDGIVPCLRLVGAGMLPALPQRSPAAYSRITFGGVRDVAFEPWVVDCCYPGQSVWNISFW